MPHVRYLAGTCRRPGAAVARGDAKAFYLLLVRAAPLRRGRTNYPALLLPQCTGVAPDNQPQAQKTRKNLTHEQQLRPWTCVIQPLE